MRRVIFGLLLMLLAASCGRNLEDKIGVEKLERIERHAWSGVDVTARVKNESSRALHLLSARVTLLYGGREVGSVVLREGVSVDKQTTQSVVTMWKFDITNPLALLVVAKKIDDKDYSQMTVSFAGEVGLGSMRKNINRKNIPLSNFMTTFGVK